jgi:thiol-disulfide isomerase/thioredoxin
VSDSPWLTWRTLAVATVLALLAAAGAVVLLADDTDQAVQTTDDGEPTEVTLVPEDEVPSFDEASYTTFDGEVLPLSSVRGTPTDVNFWGSYCTPCLTEMPAFEEVYQDVSSDEVAFLGLAVADRTGEAIEMVEETGVTYPTGEDQDASVITLLEGVVLPTTVLLDADGNVVARHSGELSAEELRTLLSDELGIET